MRVLRPSLRAGLRLSLLAPPHGAPAILVRASIHRVSKTRVERREHQPWPQTSPSTTAHPLVARRPPQEALAEDRKPPHLLARPARRRRAQQGPARLPCRPSTGPTASSSRATPSSTPTRVGSASRRRTAASGPVAPASRAGGSRYGPCCLRSSALSRACWKCCDCRARDGMQVGETSERTGCLSRKCASTGASSETMAMPASEFLARSFRVD